jgi:hypothetical protein
MTLGQGRPEEIERAVSAVPTDGELDFGAEACVLLTHEATVSKARDGFVVLRVFGHASRDALKYIGITPKRAMRLAARFIQSALHADPSLYPIFDEIIATARQRDPRRLRVVGDHVAEKSP